MQEILAAPLCRLPSCVSYNNTFRSYGTKVSVYLKITDDFFESRIMPALVLIGDPGAVIIILILLLMIAQ